MNKEQFLVELKKSEAKLIEHPAFASITSLEKLRTFMQSHVFAVWDFMSLLKRLQKELTGTELPWLTPANPRAARLINEIVLGEESDLLPDGTPISHFSMYLKAMKEMGADTRSIESFISMIREGENIHSALILAEAPLEAQLFVKKTMDIVLNGELLDAAAWFFYGRESVIPGMFKSLLHDWKINPTDAPTLVYYLDRHIQLDGEEHGPMASKIVDMIVEEKGYSYQQVLDSANAAISARIELWNGLELRLSQNS